MIEHLLKEKVEVLEWPARSPDLNPIENIWAEMQKLVYTRLFFGVKVRNKNQLFILCKACFQEVCKKYVKTLFASIPKRIENIIALKGALTKY